MTEFSKTPPTKPGWYHGRFVPNEAQTIFEVENRLMLFSPFATSHHIKAFDEYGNNKYNGNPACYEWGPRIEFPQPVPGEVLDDIKWLRSVMVAHEECTVPMIYATPTSIARFKRICDYIESLDPPKPELPLPEWKRGTWNGASCVACKIFHPGVQESRWLILMGNMLIERNLAEVAHGNLQFDGAAP